MDSVTKRKLKGRILTLISKIDELKALGLEDPEVAAILPGNLEGVEQALMAAYSEVAF